MASLISSIFGGDAPAVEPSDLFASNKFSVPSVLHKLPSAKHDGNDGKDEEVPSGSSSDDKPASTSLEVEDDLSTSPDETAATPTTTKKTPEELKVEEDRTIFVGNLPPDITRREMAGIFKPCGSVASTRLRSMAVAGVKLPPEQAGNQVSVTLCCTQVVFPIGVDTTSLR